MSVSFECTTVSALSPERLFDASRNVTAHTESMSRSREQAVAGIRSGLMELGDEVTWRAWHFGFPIRMTSRITAMDRPRSFTDEQTRGPFRTFKHEHIFQPHEAGTLMTDRVAFTAPFGAVGRVAERLVLARYLQRLIEQRNRFLQGIQR